MGGLVGGWVGGFMAQGGSIGFEFARGGEGEGKGRG
jgi:hypothetical protein